MSSAARLTDEERETLLKAQRIIEEKTGRLPLDLRFRRNELAPIKSKVGAMMPIFKGPVWAETLPELFDVMYAEGWEGD